MMIGMALECDLFATPQDAYQINSLCQTFTTFRIRGPLAGRSVFVERLTGTESETEAFTRHYSAGSTVIFMKCA